MVEMIDEKKILTTPVSAKDLKIFRLEILST